MELLDEKLSKVKTLDDIQNGIEEIKVHGLEAQIYDGKTACKWSDELIDIASKALDKKDKEYLQYVRTFWSDIE